VNRLISNPGLLDIWESRTEDMNRKTIFRRRHSKRKILSMSSLLPHLPTYTGPCNVGSSIHEVSIVSLSSKLEQSGRELGLTTIKFRLFYPSKDSGATHDSISWIPEPQGLHLDAYLKLANFSPWLHVLAASILPFYLSSALIPAIRDAPYLARDVPRPLLIFSHGLVGNMNSHSGLMGELAARGLICVAIEHRDRSGPLSLVSSGTDADKVAPMEETSIPFEHVSFFIKPGVYEKRDRQLKIRMFELSATFEALTSINKGLKLPFSSLPERLSAGSMNLDPGSVIWAGHSFGGASIVNLVKSTYHSNPGQDDQGMAGHITAALRKQISPASPVLLLDPWFMPLRSPTMRSLLDKPLPCHDVPQSTSPRTMSIHSSEFHACWPEIQSHTTKILSPTPSLVPMQTDEEATAELGQHQSKAEYIATKRRALTKSKFDGPVETYRSPARTIVLPETSHITHTDFGLIFPWLTNWFTGQKRPQEALNKTVGLIMSVAETSAE
jgi:platelet-activating factor acetylhydrolase